MVEFSNDSVRIGAGLFQMRLLVSEVANVTQTFERFAVLESDRPDPELTAAEIKFVPEQMYVVFFIPNNCSKILISVTSYAKVFSRKR